MQKLLDEMNKEMMENYIAVSKERNPVYINLRSLDKNQIIFSLVQYSIFPKNIVDFLMAARDKARREGWNEVALELTRNIGEELGTETAGVTHYKILASGIEKLTSTEIYSALPSDSTQMFIGSMKRIMGNEDPAYVMGAVYALESSAVPELQIVMDIVRIMSKQYAREMDFELKEFFAMHLGTWEPGHEDGLRRTAQKFIEEDKYADFSRGFRDVMKTMDIWWTGLYQEELQ